MSHYKLAVVASTYCFYDIVIDQGISGVHMCIIEAAIEGTYACLWSSKLM